MAKQQTFCFISKFVADGDSILLDPCLFFFIEQVLKGASMDLLSEYSQMQVQRIFHYQKKKAIDTVVSVFVGLVKKIVTAHSATHAHPR